MVLIPKVELVKIKIEKNRIEVDGVPIKGTVMGQNESYG